MNNVYKIDSLHKTLWDIPHGVIYSILKENNDFIIISKDRHVGLFYKRTNSIIIPAKYDAIGGPFPCSIPDEHYNYKLSPFEIHLDNYIGIGSIDGVLLEPLIDENEYRVYAHTYSEDIVAVELASDDLSLHPELHFLDTRNGHLSGVTFGEIRSNFNNGKATVSNGRLIMELDADFNIINDYPAYFYGFNDELYTL